MTIDFKQACAKRDELEAELLEAGKVISAIRGVGSGPMGLTPEPIRLSPEYRAARCGYDIAHKRMADFNRVFVKRFHQELTAERMNRRLALMKANATS